MYFDWFFSRNGRFFLDSAGVNPQTDKLHRFAMFLKAQETEVDTTKDVRDSKVFAFKIGIAQAFGKAVDKGKYEEMLEFADNVLEASEVAVRKAVDKLIKGGEKTATVMKGNLFGEDVEIEMEHLSHLLAGEIEAKKWRNAAKNGESFTTRLTFEADATTSAVGMKLMQVPVGAALEFLAKAGIIARGLDGNYPEVVTKALKTQNTEEIIGLLEGKGIGDLKAMEGFLDSYQTLAMELSTDQTIVDSFKNKLNAETTAAEALQAKLDGLNVTEEQATAAFGEFKRLLGAEADIVKDGKVTKFGRNLFKYPFMIFLYGAGSGRIKAELNGVLEALFAKNLVDGTIEDKVLIGAFKTLGKTLTVEEIGQLRKDIATKPYRQIMVGDVKLEQLTKLMYGEFYGNAVTDAMEAHFGELIEVNRAINTTMRAMMRMYLKAFDKLTKGKNLTVGQLEAVQGKLDRLFPAIKHPLGKEDRSDGIAIFDTETITKEDYSYLDATQTYVVDAEGNAVTKKVQSIRRKLVEAISSGAVGFTHNEDGAVIGLVMADGTVLGIHDALVLGVGQLGKIEDYHKYMLRISNNWNQLDEVMYALDDMINFKEEDINGLELWNEVVGEDIAEKEAGNYREHMDVVGSVAAINRTAEETRRLKDEIHQNAVMMHVAFANKGVVKAEEQIKQETAIIPVLEELLEIVEGTTAAKAVQNVRKMVPKGCN